MEEGEEREREKRHQAEHDRKAAERAVRAREHGDSPTPPMPREAEEWSDASSVSMPIAWEFRDDDGASSSRQAA